MARGERRHRQNEESLRRFRKIAVGQYAQHTRHFLRERRVQRDQPAGCGARADEHGVRSTFHVDVGGVESPAEYLLGPVEAGDPITY
jgi:hypothetical protein